MTIHPQDPQCEATRDDLVELALGTLSGRERAVALSHVEGCPSCRDEVERLSAAADQILTLAPEVEPQPGFEVRIFDRMGLARPRRWHLARRQARRLVLAGTALAGSLGLGLGLALTSGGGAPLDISPIVANLTADHSNRGAVYVAPGNPGWLFMSVDHAQVTGLVTCRLSTVSGHTITVGTFWLASGSGTWAYQLPVPANQVKRAWVSAGDGTVVAAATLVR